MRFAGTYRVGVVPTYTGSQCDMFSDTTQTIQIRNRIQFNGEGEMLFWHILVFVYLFVSMRFHLHCVLWPKPI